MPNVNITPVSRNKLRDALNKKKTTLNKVSESLGYGQSTMSAQISKYGGLPEPMIIGIENMYHIPRADFVGFDKQDENTSCDSYGANLLLEDVNIKLDAIFNSEVNLSKRIEDLTEGQTAIIHMMEQLEDTIFKAVDRAWKQ